MLVYNVLGSSADAIEILTAFMKAKGLQAGQIPRVLLVGNIEMQIF